tara:strand:- start:164 stop:1615 length:1452 start_codon:yes stop_codon:yes gene_type:complete
MLASIRKFSKSFFAKIFIAIIALPFILWGMGDVFRSGKQNVIAEINKEKIGSKEFISYLQNINLTSQDIERLGKDKIIEEVLTNYISEKIIALEEDKKKLKLSDKSLIKILTNDKNFQKDGKFSETRYEKFMLTSGYTKTLYEKTIRNMELKGQLLTFYSGGIRLPDFILNDMFTKNYSSKKINYIDLNKVYAKKIIADTDIKNYYEKNKKFFKEKFIKFRYLKLTPEILTGKKDYDEEYFEKISIIENNILDGASFNQIVIENKKKVIDYNFINLNKVDEQGKNIKINDKLFEKIVSIKSLGKPEFINFNNEYFITEIIDTKEITNTLADENLKKSIIAQIKITNIIKENTKLIDNIKNNKFTDKELVNYSEKNNAKINTFEIKNIKDTSKFNADLVNEIYNYSTGQFFLLSDNLFKQNYLIKIAKENEPKINPQSKIYVENAKKANAEFVKKVYKSYDNYVNANYKVEVNNKVFERIKNSF